MSRFLFITGTRTGVGKTVVTSLLARRLAERRVRVAALKPFAAGGRTDGHRLRRAAGSSLSLPEVNPWFFRAALTPLIAARMEGCRVDLESCLDHVRRVAAPFERVLIEGAGGLLSPLGEAFDARDLIRALRARVVIVAPNQLGMLNDVLLTLAALPGLARRSIKVALIRNGPPRSVTRTNKEFLAERLGKSRIVEMAYVKGWPRLLAARIPRRLARALDALAD